LNSISETQTFYNKKSFILICYKYKTLQVGNL